MLTEMKYPFMSTSDPISWHVCVCNDLSIQLLCKQVLKSILAKPLLKVKELKYKWICPKYLLDYLKFIKHPWNEPIYEQVRYSFPDVLERGVLRKKSVEEKQKH